MPKKYKVPKEMEKQAERAGDTLESMIEAKTGSSDEDIRVRNPYGMALEGQKETGRRPKLIPTSDVMKNPLESASKMFNSNGYNGSSTKEIPAEAKKALMKMRKKKGK